MTDPLGDLGLRDPDQPSKTVTDEYNAAMSAEFTPAERRLIRVVLGITPNATKGHEHD